MGQPRRMRAVTITGWGLCLVVAALAVLRAYGADWGTVLGFTLAFLIWLGLLAAGWAWFKRLDRGDGDGGDAAG